MVLTKAPSDVKIKLLGDVSTGEYIVAFDDNRSDDKHQNIRRDSDCATLHHGPSL
jgi:hypothetical protein